MAPPWSVRMPCITASPRPVRSPTPLVVKNGSKIRSTISGAMPQPDRRWSAAGAAPAGGGMGGGNIRSHLHLSEIHVEDATGLPHGMLRVAAQVQQDSVQLGGIG